MALERLTQMARAVEDNWCAAWASLGSLQVLPASLVSATPDYLRVHTPGAPEMLLNIVMRYTSETRVSAGDIERAIAPFRQARLPFQWWLTLGTQPAGLREELRALGMQTWGGATSMALALDDWEPRYPPPAAGVSLGRVSGPEAERGALRVVCDVFLVPSAPMARWTTLNPAFQVYSAWRHGAVVAALATLRHEGVAGVYHVATLPSARRQGIAGNLLMRALREARAAGCAQATLTATPEARALYERLGFRSCGTIEQWVPGPQLTYALANGTTPAARRMGWP